MKGLI